jgi:hypothetical protein
LTWNGKSSTIPHPFQPAVWEGKVNKTIRLGGGGRFVAFFAFGAVNTGLP